MKDIVLKRVKEIQDLGDGELLDCNVSFNQHIDYALLPRRIRCLISWIVYVSIYNARVRSHLECASIVRWSNYKINGS